MALTPAALHKRDTLARLAAEQEQAAKAAQSHRKAVNAPDPHFVEPTRTVALVVGTGSISPAALHRRETLARLAIERDGNTGLAPERDREGEGASEYELLLAALGEDEAALKNIASTERKEEAKRHLIDKYTAHVDATLTAAIESGKGVQDEIVAMMLIWRFDIGDFDRGLDIAEHMLRHGLRLPAIKNFVRSPATIICENVAEAGLKAASADQDFDLAALQRASQLTADYDMPDQVRAKMAKAQALHLIRAAERADENPDSSIAGAAHSARAQALDLLRRALILDSGSGVKKQIERLESWLKKHAGPDADPAAEQATDDTDEE